MTLIYIMIGAGIGLTVLRLLFLIMMRINIKMMTQMLVKLVSAGNSDRAIKLCNAALRSGYAIAIKKTLQRAQSMEGAVTEMGAGQTLRTKFAEEFDAEIAKMRKPDWIASLGVLLAVAGAALSLSSTEPPLFTLIGPVIALGIAFNSRKIVKTELSQGGEAGPRVIEAFIEEAKTKAS